MTVNNAKQKMHHRTNLQLRISVETLVFQTVSEHNWIDLQPPERWNMWHSNSGHVGGGFLVRFCKQEINGALVANIWGKNQAMQWQNFCLCLSIIFGTLIKFLSLVVRAKPADWMQFDRCQTKQLQNMCCVAFQIRAEGVSSVSHRIKPAAY